MDKNNGRKVFLEENDFDGKLSLSEQFFNLAVFLLLLILSVIITVASSQIGIFSELNTKSVLLILGFRLVFFLAIPLGWAGLAGLIIKYLARPSLARRYILEGIARRLEILIDSAIIKVVVWYQNKLSATVGRWLENKKEKKRRRLNKWKEWSECQNFFPQTGDPLPVSLFDENEED